MTNQIETLMALATTLPVASLGSQRSYIEAVEELRQALEAALGQPQAVPASNGDQPGLVSTSSLKPGHEADVWHEGSQSFYRAKLLHKLTPEEVDAAPPAQTKRLDSDESRLTPPPRLSDEQISDIAISTPPNVHTYGRAIETAVRRQFGYE
jgi:uncharacterized protein YjiS (DUF1127 family)